MARFAIKPPYTSRHIADAIINEWIDAARHGHHPSKQNIQNAIEPILDTEGGARKILIDVDDDPDNNGNRVLKICVPLPEPSITQSIEDWIDAEWPLQDGAARDEFGTAVLYGCGK